MPPAEVAQELRGFSELGSVLYIAAHPDDENTQLFAWLARGRHCRTAYLSLTRGDGGQNVLGPELGEQLGVIRTHELLAARRLDGARQFFTRALDFGFSKNPEETLSIWNRQEVLADIVRVIRTFRPDIVIIRTSPDQRRTHGHHTASGILGLEAFRLAGDPKAFPDQLPALSPWQPRRILLNVGFFGPPGSAQPPPDPSLIKVDVSGNDPLSGDSFSAIAGRSRAMHKTQGFDNFAMPPGMTARPEYFRVLGGEPASQDLFEGIDTTWGRFPGGAAIARLAAEITAQFSPADPSASVPALLQLRAGLAALPADPVIDGKRSQLDRILQSCLGLSVETVVPNPEVAPGEDISLNHTVVLRSAAIPVRWIGVRYPGPAAAAEAPVSLKPGVPALRTEVRRLPADAPLSQPYWLWDEPSPGMFHVADPSLIGRPVNPPAFPVSHVFDVAGQTLVVPDEPVVAGAPEVDGFRRRLEVVAPVELKFGDIIRLFAPGETRSVSVEVTARRPGVAGVLRLEALDGWKTSSSGTPFALVAVGDKVRLQVAVTAPPQHASASIVASAEVGGRKFSNRRIEIRYAHVPSLLLQPVARLKIVSLDLAVRAREVGYVAGAGDGVAECIAEMGCKVTPLAADDLAAEKLSRFDAVVIGIRAFNVRKDLAAKLPALFSYVEAGGNLIVQYNNPRGLSAATLAPFPLRLSDDRVTDETAPMTLLAPDHPAFNTPNRVSPADFTGWVQERGLYFPNQWDDHFIPLIACNDPGDAPLKGALLVARSGKGCYVYTGLAWFRQLPAGVPGAYRLFANLLSLGK